MCITDFLQTTSLFSINFIILIFRIAYKIFVTFLQKVVQHLGTGGKGIGTDWRVKNNNV